MNYYLRADGSDSNTGFGNTAATAWLTLNKACTVAGAGDVVYVMDAGGTFFIASQHTFTPVGAVGNTLRITPYPADAPVFDGTGGTIGETEALLFIGPGSTYADISLGTAQNIAQGSAKGRGIGISSSVTPSKANNIAIRDTLIQETWTRALGGGGDNITIDNCRVYHFAMHNINQALGSGGWATGIATVVYSDATLPTGWTIKNCYVHDGWGEGIDAFTCDNITIKDNVVENAFSKLIYVDKSQDVIVSGNKLLFNNSTYQRDAHNSDGITLSGEGTPVHSSTYEIDNVLIFNNQIMGVRDGITWFQDTNHVKNSYTDVRIFHNSMYAVVGEALKFDAVAALAPAPTACFAYNNIFDGTMTVHPNPAAWTFENNMWLDGIPALDTHTNSLYTNPRYRVPGTGYYATLKISDTSHCLGNGRSSEVTTDYAGVTRSVSAPTIGAFENSDGASITADVGILAQEGYFMTGTGAVSSTVAITGLTNFNGAKPKLVIFMWNNWFDSTPADGTASQSGGRGMGYAVTPTDRRAMTNFMLDAGVGVTDTSQRNTDVECISVMADAANRDGELDFQSFEANGFTLVVDDQFATSRRIFFLAIGGDDLLNAATFGFQCATATGNASSLAGLPFKPDGLILNSTGTDTAAPSTGVDSRFMLGVVDTAFNQGVFCGGSDDNAAISQTVAYIRGGECIAIPNSSLTSTTLRAVCNQWNSDGAQFNYTEVSGTASWVFGIAIKGGVIQVGNITTPTTEATTTITTTGLHMVGGLFFNAMRAQSSSDTVTDHDKFSLGLVSGPTIAQNCIALFDEDAIVASSDVNVGVGFDDIGETLLASGSRDSFHQIAAISDDAVDYYSNTDALGEFVVWWAIGDTTIETPPASGESDNRSPFIMIW